MRARLFLTFLAICIVNLITAQDAKRVVSYDVYVSSDNPQMAAYIDQMENSLLEIYFTSNKMRSNLFIGEVSTTNTISLKDKDSTLILMDNMMMGKIGMKVPKNGFEDGEENPFEVKNVELVNGETKEIMGYTCKKAIITRENDKEFDVWYTEEIVPSYKDGQFFIEEIPGLPLEMYSSFGNMDLKMVAFSIKNKIPKKKEKELFDYELPKGYSLKTMDDMKNFGGGR